ncbi:MAG: 30S ribosomal protein S20 [Gaiellales bacterium]|nr:30S ribosomal protein S20 [Gaiellales bacterium]
MANTPQQRKRVRIAARQRMENLRYRSSIKTLFKRLNSTLTAGEEEAAATVAAKLTSTIDKAAAHKAIHKNNASHKKARVARALAQK